MNLWHQSLPWKHGTQCSPQGLQSRGDNTWWGTRHLCHGHVTAHSLPRYLEDSLSVSSRREKPGISLLHEMLPGPGALWERVPVLRRQ